ncbi:MAG: lytic transglycosylase domain-containing protein [Rudaea sp.]|uniref:lytic transglycosylase domain-containing protein n=1 Tax=Rudaea sp. TaxID=2136325 RepID=UPI0039E53CB8
MKRSLRQWGWWLCVGLAAGGLAREAFAGAMYRCNGSHGEIAITNKPAGYTACTKLSDYAEPEVKARKPALKPDAPKADFADVVSGEARQNDAAKPAVSSTQSPAAASKAPAVRPRYEYRSAPPTPFSDVVGETRLDGEAPTRTMANATERPDAATQVRRGAVFRVARANGIVEYTNVRPSGGAYTTLFTYIATCYACDVKSAIDFATLALNLDAYKDEVAASASEFGVDQALLRAVIHAESAFNPNAISVKGAEGLMQLMPTTANDMGVTSPFDPAQNIRGGARYLAGLLKLFNGDERLATAAYNSGPQNVQKYSGVPPFDETRVYVDRVATLRKRYGEAR